MKRFITCLFIILGCMAAQAQTNTYLFVGSFAEQNGGAALTEVLACGAVPGNFGSSLINTTTGTCGTGPKPVFNFNAGAGLAYPNGQLSGTYTINLFFSFTDVSGYRRIIDFKDGQTDVGLYILNGSLNFYPNGNVGAVNTFVPNTFYLVTLVRDGVTGQIQVYVDGMPFVNYNDAAGDYATAAITTPIYMFRDNIAGNAQCENSAGRIKYMSIAPTTATALEVAQTYASICTIALPVNLTSFQMTDGNGHNLLTWHTAAEMNTDNFTIQRSNDARIWKAIGALPAKGAGTYHFADDFPLNGDNYYRLRITDLNGDVSYSKILHQRDGKAIATLRVTPNPATDVLTIENASSSFNGADITVTDVQGKVVYHALLRDRQIIDTRSWAAGIYAIRVPGLAMMKIVKQ